MSNNVNTITKLPSLKGLQTQYYLSKKKNISISKATLEVRIRKNLTNNQVIKRKSQICKVNDKIRENLSPIGYKNFSFVQGEEEDFEKLILNLS